MNEEEDNEVIHQGVAPEAEISKEERVTDASKTGRSLIIS